MVLDPFSALGVAGNIVQFVDFSSKLFSNSREAYRSPNGATVENEELMKATRELQALCVSLASVARMEQNLKAEGPHKRWQSFRQAFRTVWNKEKIRAMENKIASYRNVLALQLMVMQE
jgi:hypothetical protein